MDIREIINRVRAGNSGHQISRELGIDRRTVKRYREWAKEQGLLEGEMPPIEELQRRLAESMAELKPPQTVSSVEPYRELVEKLLAEKVAVKAIYERLKERGFEGSSSAVYRFARGIKKHKPEATVRVERAPGEESQVDFGYAGQMIDAQTGELRRSWAFVMTLSWSRHQ